MSIFNLLFKRQPKQTSRAVILSGGVPVLSMFSGNAYASDVFRAAVDAVARNAAKLQGTHVIKSKEGRYDGDNSLNRLLQIRPNFHTNAYDFLYKLVTHYFLYNNAFALIIKDDRGDAQGIYPLKGNNVEFVTDGGDNLYCKFYFSNSKQFIFPYEDLIHLRRHFNDNDLFGDSNAAITPALELAHTMNAGIITAIKNNALIRGILRFNQNLAPDKLKEEKERFLADYMQIENNGGLAVTDSKADYLPLENKPLIVDERQIQAVKDKIYSYLGISEKIVNSSYSEDEWHAFYESTIEPVAVQLSLEFTNKLFTPREIAFGNEIIFESNRLQYSSVKTKVMLIKELAPMKLLTRNQALNILNLPSVPDGEEYIQSLNFISGDIANQYQLSGGNEK